MNKLCFAGLACWISASSFGQAAEPLPWLQAEHHRERILSVPAQGKTGFTSLSPEQTGIRFTNRVTDAQVSRNRILLNGSGVAAGDIDGDGWCDLYFCRLDGPNVLYKNLGNWKFADVTKEAGVACDGQFSSAACFADLDGDGHLDLLVNSIGGGTRCFFNDGHGHFHETTATSGLITHQGSHSMTLADIDGDGDLDLYVTNYRTTTVRDGELKDFKLKTEQGKVSVPPEYADRFRIMKAGDGIAAVEMGEADVLYLNDGHGHFEAAPWNQGRFIDEYGKTLPEPPRDWGLSAMFRDLNGDGAPDLYVCNDFFSPDRIWLNDGRGNFRAQPRLALRHTPLSSMSVDFADIDRDGQDDFVVMEMLSRNHVDRQAQRSNFENDYVPWWGWPLDIKAIDSRPQVLRNTLFHNEGAGYFAEIGQMSGLQASEWSWGATFVDVDLDGYEDLLVANGHGQNAIDSDLLKTFSPRHNPNKAAHGKDELAGLPPLRTANCAFRNRGDLTFEEVGSVWGFDLLGISNGMVLADLDNDGDLDVVLNNLNQRATLLRNDSIAPRVAVRLKGSVSNTQGIGAKVKLLGGPVAQSQEIICGGRYLCGDDPVRVFAAGPSTQGMTLEVKWRSGKISRVRDVHSNRLYEVEEAGAVAEASEPPPQPKPIFREVSDLIQHTHLDEPFDDLERQPLLPRKLSQNGPGVAWVDLNGDGWEDLVIGSGRNGLMRVMLNDGLGAFRLVKAPAWAELLPADQTGLLAFSPSKGSVTLLAGLSGYETGLDQLTNSVARYEIWPGGIDSVAGLAIPDMNVGPMALADFDGDGDLDLFVGGQAVPGRYPAATPSRIFRNERGTFVPAADLNPVLADVGLVNGAVWSDLTGDGFPELILACEWGPVRIFRNTAGKLSEAKELGVDKFRGWWNGVTTGDLDGDGRMDLIAANWGRNTKYQEYLHHEIRLLYGDIDGNGTQDLLEAVFEPSLKQWMPLRDRKTLTAALPFLTDRFPTYRAFGSASLEEMFGDTLTKLGDLRVNTLDSMAFLNRGDHFEAIPLPREAQFAPAFGVAVADFDGDGHEDVFLSQNFFAVDRETGRYDGGRGLWLRGDGKGTLTAVSAEESGVLIFGEQRGAALADYDGDGRVDLAVTQNSAGSKLFHNEQARPGLRVLLIGPPGNDRGVGAVLRVKSAGQLGPAREIHGGSGYLSQDSPVAVLAARAEIEELTVHWPGGKKVSYSCPPGAREVSAAVSGELKQTK